MYIFVDESGTFTSSEKSDAWCVVAAYVSPESGRAALQGLINKLRLECSNGAETKLGDVSEERFLKFLDELHMLKGIAFAVAVDLGLHEPSAVARHRDMQADKVVEHRDKMLYESGKQALTDLANEIRSLPVQLYIQLVSQVVLFHKVLTRAPLYYVQRHPQTLGHLRWRLDRKDRTPTLYEKAFRKILPALLQSASLNEPMLMLEGADYRYFRHFDYADGEEPTYLKTVYGIDSKGGANVSKMIGEDFQLVDSKSVPGVQVADLFASGLRRLLQGRFHAQSEVAKMLGANMVQELKHEPPVTMITLDQPGRASQLTAFLIKQLAAHNRSMLVR